MSSQSKRYEDGRRAELAVADYLFALGFCILGRNVRLGALELDVIARKGRLVVIAEVRTRGATSYLPAFASIDRTKRMRLRRAADRWWRACRSGLQDVDRIRIDVASVVFSGAVTRVEYVAGAIY